MSSLTLKDVPDALLNRLRALAAAERRSLNQQAIVLLEGSLDAQEGASVRAERQIAAWRELAGGWVSTESFGDEVAAVMEARSLGRDVDL